MARWLHWAGCMKMATRSAVVPSPVRSTTGSLCSVVILAMAIIGALAQASSAAPATTRSSTTPSDASSTQAAQPTTRPQESAQAEDGQWIRAAKDYANTRYSGLDQINTENAKDLKVAWTFSTGVNRGHEAAPIVVGDTMYVATPYPNILYALDLNNGGAIKWKYEPKPAAAAQGVACCDVVNRGAVYDNGKIIFNTLDCHTIAVDAKSGKELWNVKLGEINLGETVTMSPLVVNGKVYVGNSGAEYGVRGWLKALDVNDGHLLWTAWSTGSDKDVLIGDKFKPFYEQDRGKDLGISSWPPDRWKLGGGNGLGVRLVRSGIQPDLLRHRQSRCMEPRTAAGGK